jgi:hypothetical protein
VASAREEVVDLHLCYFRLHPGFHVFRPRHHHSCRDQTLLSRISRSPPPFSRNRPAPHEPRPHRSHPLSRLLLTDLTRYHVSSPAHQPARLTHSPRPLATPRHAPASPADSRTPDTAAFPPARHTRTSFSHPMSSAQPVPMPSRYASRRAQYPPQQRPRPQIPRSPARSPAQPVTCARRR